VHLAAAVVAVAAPELNRASQTIEEALMSARERGSVVGPLWYTPGGLHGIAEVSA
jgi:hypothetical protein